MQCTIVDLFHGKQRIPQKKVGSNAKPEILWEFIST